MTFEVFYVPRCLSHYINYSLYYKLTSSYRIYARLVRSPVAQLSAVNTPAFWLTKIMNNEKNKMNTVSMNT